MIDKSGTVVDENNNFTNSNIQNNLHEMNLNDCKINCNKRVNLIYFLLWWLRNLRERQAFLFNIVGNIYKWIHQKYWFVSYMFHFFLIWNACDTFPYGYDFLSTGNNPITKILRISRKILSQFIRYIDLSRILEHLNKIRGTSRAV